MTGAVEEFYSSGWGDPLKTVPEQANLLVIRREDGRGEIVLLRFAELEAPQEVCNGSHFLRVRVTRLVLWRPDFLKLFLFLAPGEVEPNDGAAADLELIGDVP